MPPAGGIAGEHSGSDGEDWKCRRVLGRFRDGVGGIESVGSAPFPVVFRVRARLLGLRLGGVGGLTKEGEEGAEAEAGAF